MYLVGELDPLCSGDHTPILMEPRLVVSYTPRSLRSLRVDVVGGPEADVWGV